MPFLNAEEQSFREIIRFSGAPRKFKKTLCDFAYFVLKNIQTGRKIPAFAEMTGVEGGMTKVESGDGSICY